LPGFVDATAAERRNVHLPARQAQPATLVASAEPRELVARAIAILAEAGEAFPLRRGVPLRGIR
jgi:hypothetical protein